MEDTATETPATNWILSTIFNTLGFEGTPSLQSAFDQADSVVDGVLEVIESGFRFFQLEELANRVENMQNENLLARIFGMEAEGTVETPSVEDTEPEVAEAPILRTDPHFRM